MQLFHSLFFFNTLKLWKIIKVKKNTHFLIRKSLKNNIYISEAKEDESAVEIALIRAIGVSVFAFINIILGENT